jgi:predicted metalloendopeptidase
LHDIVDRKAWIDPVPTTINAFYFPLYNDISILKKETSDNTTPYLHFSLAFPAAFLQPPFFHKDAPKYELIIH